MAKNSHLKDLQALGPLEVFRADLEEEGSFDEAVAGCDYVFLVAAPAIPHPNDPEVCYSGFVFVLFISSFVKQQLELASCH